jgi:signal transduction histidine kinase
MGAALRESPEGHWIGTSPLDDVERIYAFATVPDYGLTVVVGTDRAKAMADAASWERNWLLGTSGVTALIVLLAFALLRAQSISRRQHETLAHERAILAATLTGMSDGIMMVDRDLRLLAWNQHFPEFTGVPRDILRPGLPMEDILRGQVTAGEFGPVDVEAEVARRMSLLRTGASMGTIERPRPGGRQLEIRRNQLPGGGFVTLYTDVTARRQTEERLRQAQTMAAVGRLTAGVAHDFNNLLAAISGNAEILHEQLHEGDHSQRLAVILQAASRGSDLVRRLLASSRRQPLAPVLVDLNKVVDGMGGLLRATLGRRIKVETRLDANLWPARIDPAQIEQVILNLSINARDAMPDGGTLTISTSNTILGPQAMLDLPSGEYVVVAVSDTGTGMSEEVQRSAFEPFFTTKPPGQGSGLGLSQVYGVATQSGGSVRIDSAIGKGTKVNVLFPRATQDSASDGRADPDRATAAPAPLESGSLLHRTILVVDDEVECRDTVAALLTANGFTPVVAEDGLSALRLIDGGLDFDLLLADFLMPEMSGAELARRVRARRPSVPVVFLTGGDDAWISGERWVLMKPFLSRTLIDTVRAALGLTQKDQARYNRPQMV